MKKINRSIIMAVLTIMLALSLITGATYALFVGESKTNIAVTAGKLDVRATVDDVVMTSTLGQALGTADVVGNEVVLNGFVPGDKATFTINLHNNSDFAVLYRTLIKVEEDNGLFEGLTIEIDGQGFNGFTAVSNWELASVATKTLEVSIELPESSGLAFQGKSTKLVYVVEAVQGNIQKENADVNEVELYTAYDLIYLSKLVNEQAKNQNGKTIKLMNDIDMQNKELVAIGSVRNASSEFAGTFDGQGFTLRNVNIISLDDYGTGLFGSKGGQTTAVIKNFTMDGGKVTGPKNVAPVFGMAYNATVENIVVKNIEVNQTGEKRASGLVANSIGTGMMIRNNHVENITIIGTSDLHELIANESGGAISQNNTFTNVTLTTDVNLEVTTDAELLSALMLDAEYVSIKLMNDLSINVSNANIKFGTASTKKITIDGNGHLLTLETTYWSRTNTVNPEAVMVFKNMDLTSSQATGTWNSYNVTFLNKVELINVNVLKSVAISNDAVLKNVTITEDKAYYGLWITAEGQTVDIDGLVINAPNGRGIAIKDEYVDDILSVTLTVKNAEFISKDKAAILVTSTAGATIMLDNIDITNVLADNVNHIWVDEDRAAALSLVTVNSPFTVILEP